MSYKGKTFKNEKTYAESSDDLKKKFKKSKLSKSHTMKIKTKSKRKSVWGNYTYTVDFIPKK